MTIPKNAIQGYVGDGWWKDTSPPPPRESPTAIMLTGGGPAAAVEVTRHQLGGSLLAHIEGRSRRKERGLKLGRTQC